MRGGRAAGSGVDGGRPYRRGKRSRRSIERDRCRVARAPSGRSRPPRTTPRRRRGGDGRRARGVSSSRRGCGRGADRAWTRRRGAPRGRRRRRRPWRSTFWPCRRTRERRVLFRKNQTTAESKRGFRPSMKRDRVTTIRRRDNLAQRSAAEPSSIHLVPTPSASRTLGPRSRLGPRSPRRAEHRSTTRAHSPRFRCRRSLHSITYPLERTVRRHTHPAVRLVVDRARARARRRPRAPRSNESTRTFVYPARRRERASERSSERSSRVPLLAIVLTPARPPRSSFRCPNRDVQARERRVQEAPRRAHDDARRPRRVLLRGRAPRAHLNHPGVGRSEAAQGRDHRRDAPSRAPERRGEERSADRGVQRRVLRLRAPARRARGARRRTNERSDPIDTRPRRIRKN